ncbi:hypothetical protein ACIBQ1_28415 [Nonomuraea sp. NPDC050153]|uniref:hypothetical protein n=1 Tax=Nonomuraea sp. NPDC050153 TaxID=3364359 RepID=UPI0037A3A7D6
MRGRALSVLALALTLTLAACGSGDGGGSDVASVSGTGTQAAASAKPSEDPQDRGLKFAQCMRENGVDVPDPEPGKGIMMKFDGSVPEEKVKAAQEACKQYAPTMGGQGGQVDPKRAEALRKVAQCMRDNGVESFPDPEGGGMRITGTVGEDPDFKSAQQKCQKEFSEAGMGGM